jgi:predicted RNase H-like HicB family nuclease
MVAVVALIDGRPGAYGIAFPDFPGCVAGGASVDETLRRGREGLAFHIESMAEVGEALPRVRDISEIRADPEFAEDFAGVAMVALVDVDLPGRALRLNISMDEHLVARVDQAATASGESRSGYIAAAVRARIASGA